MAVQESDPPNVYLLCVAGKTIIGRILDNENVDEEDLERLRAYRQVLDRLRDHLETNATW